MDIRTWITYQVGRITNWIEHSGGEHYYENSDIHANQFVGRVPMPDDDFIGVLEDLGFEENPCSGDIERSWRQVDSPTQLHAVFYDGDKIPQGDTGYTYVYAHVESDWESNPWSHFRGFSYNPDQGVKRLKNLLNEYGVNHEAIRA